MKQLTVLLYLFIAHVAAIGQGYVLQTLNNGIRVPDSSITQAQVQNLTRDLGLKMSTSAANVALENKVDVSALNNYSTILRLNDTANALRATINNIPVGGVTSFGAITGLPSDNAALVTALNTRLAIAGNGSQLTGITNTQISGLGTLSTQNGTIGDYLTTATAASTYQTKVTRVWQPNDVVNNNGVANTIADITGLAFPVLANTTYKFRFFIIYTSAATTTGSRFSINGPATTFLNYNSQYTINNGSPTFNWALSGYNLPAASNASSLAANNIAIIEGVIRPSANGTVIARFASEITASAITALGVNRSYVEYEIIN